MALLGVWWHDQARRESEAQRRHPGLEDPAQGRLERGAHAGKASARSCSRKGKIHRLSLPHSLSTYG